MEWEDNPQLIYHSQVRVEIFLTLGKPQFPGNKRTARGPTKHLPLCLFLAYFGRLMVCKALGYSLAEVVRASPSLFHRAHLGYRSSGRAPETSLQRQSVLIHNTVTLWSYNSKAPTCRKPSRKITPSLYIPKKITVFLVASLSNARQDMLLLKHSPFIVNSTLTQHLALLFSKYSNLNLHLNHFKIKGRENRPNAEKHSWQ